LLIASFSLYNYIKKIEELLFFLKIHNIDNRKHNTSKYCKLDFYIIKTFEDKILAISNFKQEIYVIDNSRAKIFINIDILDFEVIVVNVAQKKLVIDSCNITTSLFVIL